LQTGRREEAEHCLHIINEKDFTTENIDLLIDFAKANGGIEYAEQRMQVYHDKAVEVLMTLPESEAREGLLLLADYIVERRK
jgi:octaprenyl-diphosphate synthase